MKLLKRDDLLVSLFEERHRKQLVSIWKEAFSDSEEYINKFLDLSCAKTYVYCDDDLVVGTVSVFDVCLENKKGAYIYALAVDSKHRGRGVASSLLEFVQETLLLNGYDFSLVVPSPYECLESFYKNRGFVKELHLGVSEFHRSDKESAFTYQKATVHECKLARKSKQNTVLHSNEFFDYVYDDMISDGAEVLKICIDADDVFCICYNKGEYVIIKEFIGGNRADAVSQAVMRIFNSSKAICVSSYGTVRYPYALLKDFKSNLNFNIYANLLLDGFENRF